MVKEGKSMLNHFNSLEINNYTSNSQVETIVFTSRLSYVPNSSTVIMKAGSNRSSRSLSVINSLANNHLRNGHLCHRSSSFSSIYEVYSNNLFEGSRLIRHLAKTSDIVAIDTEFPGVVCRVNGEYSSTTVLSYHNIKCNTDLMTPIQIGFSFFNNNGEQSEINTTVQFNLKWDMDTEIFAEESIVMLEGCGVDFSKHKRHGIEIQDFAEVFLTSGLPLNERITWIGFHCAYDWAYMIKICTNMPDMPQTYDEFNELLLVYFPKTIDIKTIMTDKNLPKSGLQDLASSLNVNRVGAQHQAGSDAKLTGDTFFNFFKAYCNGVIEEKYINQIYGLNYCPTSGATMLWLPNQSPTPDDIGNNMSSNCHNLKHCRSLNLVNSVDKDHEQMDNLLCYCRQNKEREASCNSSFTDSDSRSSRQSCARSQNDSQDEI